MQQLLEGLFQPQIALLQLFSSLLHHVLEVQFPSRQHDLAMYARQDLFSVEGFGEVVDRPHLQGVRDGLAIHQGGEHDHRWIAPLGVGLHLFEYIKAGHVRHHQIQQYQIDGFGFEQFEALHATLSFEDGVLSAQAGVCDHAVRPVIIDDQDGRPVVFLVRRFFRRRTDLFGGFVDWGWSCLADWFFSGWLLRWPVTLLVTGQPFSGQVISGCRAGLGQYQRETAAGSGDAIPQYSAIELFYPLFDHRQADAGAFIASVLIAKPLFETIIDP